MQLKCPHCAEPFSFPAGPVARCINGHTFDRAREGYLNLHLPQHARLSGDTPESLEARRIFLQSGHYAPLQGEIASLVKQFAGTESPEYLLDTGCGEGYYTAFVAEALGPDSKMKVTGTDISRYAIKQAAKRYKSVQWLVSSSSHLPFLDSSADWILSIFSPVFEQEFERVLKPGGYLLVVKPGQGHLAEFRTALFGRLLYEPTTLPLPDSPHWKLVCHKEVQYTAALNTADLNHLLLMTPYGWKADASRHEHIRQLSDLTVNCDFNIYLYQRQLDHYPA